MSNLTAGIFPFKSECEFLTLVICILYLKGGGQRYGYIYMLAFLGGGVKKKKACFIHRLSTGYPQAKSTTLKQRQIFLISSIAFFDFLRPRPPRHVQQKFPDFKKE